MKSLLAILSALWVADVFARASNDTINHSKVPGESTVMPSPRPSNTIIQPGVHVPSPDELTLTPAPEDNPTPSPAQRSPTTFTPSPKMDSPTPNMISGSGSDQDKTNPSDDPSKALPAPETPSPAPSTDISPNQPQNVTQTDCPPTCGLDPSYRIFFEKVRADIKSGLTCDHFHDTCKTLEQRGGCDCRGCKCLYKHDPTRKQTSTATLKTTTVPTSKSDTMEPKQTSTKAAVVSSTKVPTNGETTNIEVITTTTKKPTLQRLTKRNKLQTTKARLDEGKVAKQYKPKGRLPSCFNRCGSTRPIMNGLDYCFCHDKCTTESSCCFDYEETCVGGEAEEDERAIPNPVSPAAIIIISISIVLVVAALAGCAGYVVVRRKTQLKGATSTFASHSLTDSNSSLLGSKSLQ